MAASGPLERSSWRIATSVWRPCRRRDGRGRGSSSGATARGIEQLGHFLIRCLAEVLVELPDGAEELGCAQADDVVDFGTQRVDSLLRGHRHRHHQTLRFPAPNTPDCRTHRASRRYPVVNNDNRAILNLLSSAPSSIGLLAAANFFHLFGDFAVEIVLAHRKRRHHFFIEYALRMVAVDHCTNPQFGLSGRSELSYHDDIERSVERYRDLVSDGHTAARYPEYHGVLGFVLEQCSRQPLSRLLSVFEHRLQPPFVAALLKMSLEPIARQSCDFLKRAGLFEQVTGAGDYL